MSTVLKVHVTSQIIRRTKHCNSCDSTNCPIAEALKPLFPFVSVGPHSFMIDHRKEWDELPHIPLPVGAQNFLSEWDTSTPEQREQMPELEFEVDIPDTVIESIDISELTNHPTLEIVKV